MNLDLTSSNLRLIFTFEWVGLFLCFATFSNRWRILHSNTILASARNTLSYEVDLEV